MDEYAFQCIERTLDILDRGAMVNEGAWIPNDGGPADRRDRLFARFRALRDEIKAARADRAVPTGA